ncbi:cyclic lactone autoinducer peptide [Sedimentibacter sp.]|uniref:cyclic lactone autoinducer peptide n=1 Tax=Sedimentibacter sp. TaxID=1960295 RepID=UPI0037D9EB48
MLNKIQFYCIMILKFEKEEYKLKKTISFLSCIAAFLVVTAQTTMGTTCLLWVNQPKVPQCLLKND